ncbi:MAG: ABC transporter ATP-binding protein [Thermoprotei archaeon]|nr:ABC transporter ATP-binding protein [Thermoprotei archaeon]
MLGKILQVSGLRKYFGGVKAVDGVSFTMDEGERLFIVGPNGAGKTTLVNLISGYIMPDSGTIMFDGRDVTRLSLASRVGVGIARSFQLVNVFWGLTVLENLSIAVASRLKVNTNMFKSLESYKAVLEEALELAELSGLTEVLDKRPSEISQGDRKLLDIAITLALKPKLVMLDEPTSGVSTREKFEVMDRVLKTLHRFGASSIIVEHDMEVVKKYSNRVLVMHEGKIIGDGAPSDILSKEDVRRILLGEAYA